MNNKKGRQNYFFFWIPQNLGPILFITSVKKGLGDLPPLLFPPCDLYCHIFKSSSCMNNFNIGTRFIKM